MLLTRLKEYEERQAAHTTSAEAIPTGYASLPVRWLIELGRNGKLQGLTSQSSGSERGPDRGKRILVPNLRRGNVIAPILLADNQEYVLGIPREDTRADRVRQQHQAFVELTENCMDVTKEPTVTAVHSFLKQWSAESDHAKLPEGLKPEDRITFRVEDMLPVDLPSVRAFWGKRFLEASQTSKRTEGNGGHEAVCLVCGTNAQIAATHPVAIKGIPKGQTSGTSLVSFNARAFESYGLTQSFNSPVCVHCAELYAKGLNRLIADESSRLRIGGTVYVFWTREPTDIASLIVSVLNAPPDAKDVKRLLESPLLGGTARAAGDRLKDKTNALYATALTASGGRAVVREWEETTVEEARQNLARYLRMQAITPLYEDAPPFYSVFRLARSLMPDRPARAGSDANNPPALAATALLHVALGGGKLPDWLLYQAVRRNRAEQGPSPPRVALIKLVLQSRKEENDIDTKEVGTMDASTQQTPAYQCGRLLALIEQAQEAAIPRAKATLVDRFYGSASSAPASVFGTLLRNTQSHLAKLRRDKPGLENHLQRQLQECLPTLGSHFPPTLNLKEQAVFALGYYYQRAARFRRADAAASHATNDDQETAEQQ